jgi:signal peptidase I
MINCRMNEFMELSEEVLNREHYLRFRMRGVSMFPSLKDDDIITIKRVDTSDIRPGDIIFFAPPFYKGITHRVIKRTIVDGKSAFITKGDLCPFFDGYVYPEHILGRLVAVERNGECIKLDKKASALQAFLYANILCFQPQLFTILRKFKNYIRHRLLGEILHRAQNLKAYHYIINIVVKKEKIIYRVATQDDALSLARFHRAYYWPAKLKLLVKYFQWHLAEFSKNCGYCLLAQKADKIIGSVTVKRSSGDGANSFDWAIHSLFISWRYRGIGIEKKLIALVTEKAKEQGADKVDITHFEKHI